MKFLSQVEARQNREASNIYTTNMEPGKNKPKMPYPLEFDGWPNYPASLGFSPLMVDAEASNDLLKRSANRLFVDDGEDSLGLLEFGPLSHGELSPSDVSSVC